MQWTPDQNILARIVTGITSIARDKTQKRITAEIPATRGSVCRICIMEGAIERPLILLECGGSGRLTTKMGAEMHGAQTCCAEIKTSPDVGSKAASAPLAEE